MSLQVNVTEKTYERNSSGPMPLPQSIWESPIYRFHELIGNSARHVFFDVTKSAVLSDTKRDLAQALDWAVEKTNQRNPAILDFGAGRLRNTIYLLSRGHSVTAVDFEKLLTSDSVRPNLQSANGHAPRFSELVYPSQFIRTNRRFDLIILINVLNVMPVPSERYLALQYCPEKLTDRGLILWYSQTTQSAYKGMPSFGDGLVMSTKEKYKTFYKDFNIDEIEELFAANGLRLADTLAQQHIQCRLYKKVGRNPMNGVLTPRLIRRHVEGDVDYEPPRVVTSQPRRLRQNAILNVPDPRELSRSLLYRQALLSIPPGTQANNTYQNLVGAIFLYLFPHQLEKMEFEHEMHHGRDRVDLFFRNHALGGFFVRFTIPNSPYVYVECKNYTGNLGSGEVNQSIERVATTRSHLGIVTCRRARRTWMNEKCGDVCDDEKTIMWLDDSDLFELLDHAGDEAAIGRILMARIDEINSTQDS